MMEGMSHLLEHLMFTKLVQKKSMMETLQTLGVWNASTSYDRTFYFLRTSPEKYKESIDTMMQLCTTLTVTEEQLKNEVRIILHEKEYHRFNSPVPHENIESLFFEAQSPYKKSIIGSKESLENIKLTDVYMYFQRYYQDSIMFIGSCWKDGIKKKVDLYLSSNNKITYSPFKEHQNEIIAPLSKKTNKQKKRTPIMPINNIIIYNMPIKVNMISCTLGYKVEIPLSIQSFFTAELIKYAIKRHLFTKLRDELQSTYTPHCKFVFLGKSCCIFKINFICMRSEVQSSFDVCFKTLRNLEYLKDHYIHDFLNIYNMGYKNAEDHIKYSYKIYLAGIHPPLVVSSRLINVQPFSRFLRGGKHRKVMMCGDVVLLNRIKKKLKI
jgi:secreted Zn-dependent insulinase-like peptidase